MGSNQSIDHKDASAGAQISEGGVTDATGVIDRLSDTAKNNKPERLRENERKNIGKNTKHGFERVQRKCRKKKRAYDKCYAEWYGGAFVSAKLENEREDCDDLFEGYKHCILMGMKQDRDRRGVGASKPGSALAEFEKEQIEE
mmetsp:Transcript_16541/g.47621  ORF Transcript_16541/g.47621 Transcript_16541/m.47621 type:complete len:143 (-) Transcript_16541:1524-1952(-)|eukprot:CAMPEP_0113531340 /NCGR_PEP_ID=MMETSP0015_2-20120614/3443_1 /TAXON_ID=2838 /ORGANISM="Odontella" /LENGTH=142 /DNA_ID=CAMNT_0000430167 /DNA_START=526 /DNA_END=954 /DNA_ORIENTATION=+ /assembly_acc=CAM_ASM_000160